MTNATRTYGRLTPLTSLPAFYVQHISGSNRNPSAKMSCHIVQIKESCVYGKRRNTGSRCMHNIRRKMSDDTTKERHQFTVTLIALQNDLRPSECTILRVTRESGGGSAGQRREIHAGVPYELTPYSVVQCHGHVALTSDMRSYSIYCAHNNQRRCTVNIEVKTFGTGVL